MYITHDNKGIIKAVFKGDPNCVQIDEGDVLVVVPDDVTIPGGTNTGEYNQSTWLPLTVAEVCAMLKVTLRADQTVMWSDTKWIVVSDFRGTTLAKSDKSDTMVITQPDETPDDYKSEGFYPYSGDLKYSSWDNSAEKWVDNLDQYRSDQIAIIESAFDQQFTSGHFLSATIGIEVDLRRMNEKNDVQNVESLISSMTRNNVPSITYVGYTENVTATLAQVQALKGEMEDQGLALYQKKWTLEAEIEAAATIDQVKAITW